MSVHGLLDVCQLRNTRNNASLWVLSLDNTDQPTPDQPCVHAWRRPPDGIVPFSKLCDDIKSASWLLLLNTRHCSCSSALKEGGEAGRSDRPDYYLVGCWCGAKCSRSNYSLEYPTLTPRNSISQCQHCLAGKGSATWRTLGTWAASPDPVAALSWSVGFAFRGLARYEEKGAYVTMCAYVSEIFSY